MNLLFTLELFWTAFVADENSTLIKFSTADKKSLSLSPLEGDTVKKEREWGREGEWGLIRDRRGRGNTSVSLSFSGPYAIHQSKLCVSVGLREGALQCSMYYFANVFLNSLSLFLFLWQFSSCQHRPSCQFSLAAAAANRSSCFVLLRSIAGAFCRGLALRERPLPFPETLWNRKKEKHLFTERKERKTQDNIRTDRRTVLLAQQTIFWHVWQAPLFKCMW